MRSRDNHNTICQCKKILIFIIFLLKIYNNILESDKSNNIF